MYSWLERATAAGLAGRICSRKSPKVPSQRCARCRRLKELRDSMKPARRAVASPRRGVVRRELCHRHFPPVSLRSHHRANDERVNVIVFQLRINHNVKTITTDELFTSSKSKQNAFPPLVSARAGPSVCRPAFS